MQRNFKSVCIPHFPLLSQLNKNWNPGIHLSPFNPERKVPCPSFSSFLIHLGILNSTRKDTILPLSAPVTGLDGQEMNEIPVPNNTNIIIAIYAANRNPEIWGPDSYDWKPERWLDPPPESVTKAHIPGVYSHLYVLIAFCNGPGTNSFSPSMTFLGGGRACMWAISTDKYD